MVEAWLLLFYGECICFFIVAMQYAHQIFKLFQIPNENRGTDTSGGKTRLTFLIMMFLSTLARFVSILSISLTYAKVEDDTVLNFAVYAIWTFPILLFLFSYSVIILFWAEVYHSVIAASSAYLRYFLIIFNATVGILYVLLLVLKALLYLSDDFSNYVTFMFGIYFLLAAIGFAYYGNCVVKCLYSMAKHRENNILKRIKALAIFCLILFSLRGIYSIAEAVKLFPVLNTFHKNSTLQEYIVVFLFGDFIPSVVILYSFRQRTHFVDPISRQDEYPLISDSSDPYESHGTLRPSSYQEEQQENF